MRTWAVDHRHDYALVYGSPVPGYAAPEDTVGPSVRVTGVLLDLLGEVQSAGQAPEEEPVPRSVRRAIRPLHDFVDEAVSDGLLLRGLQAWGGLLGAISLELFGHLHRVVDENPPYFDQLARRLCPF